MEDKSLNRVKDSSVAVATGRHSCTQTSVRFTVVFLL